MGDEDYGQYNVANTLATGVPKEMYDPRMTVRARIAAQKKHLSAQLEHLNKIETLLNENPAIEQFQDLMAKVHL